MAAAFFSRPAPVDTTPVAAAAPVEVEPVDPFEVTVKPFFETHCLDCHGEDSPEGDLNLASDLAADDARTRMLENRHMWEHAFNMIKISAMPPADMPAPEPAEHEAIVAWLDQTLFHVDCEANPSPGRVTARRLNRIEYNNTVRDLLGVEVTPADDFPTDEVGYGFDNIGDVQSTPPLLVEKYLDAAETVAKAAIATAESQVRLESRSAGQLRAENKAGKSGAFVMIGNSTARAAWRDVHFRKSGEYEIKLIAGADQHGDEKAKLALELGGKEIGRFTVTVDGGAMETFTTRLRVEEGRQPLTVRFLNDHYVARGKDKGDRNGKVAGLEVRGPFGLSAEQVGENPLIVARPGKGADGKTRSVEEAARENLRPLVKRAFRRPVTEAEVDRLAQFAKLIVEEGGSFEEGMQGSLQAMLCAPDFLFRVEPDDASTGRIARRLDEWELASRLSYFLWNTMPDAELFARAEDHTLGQPAVLEAQITRMLADARSDAMLDNFAGQWLGLRTLPDHAVDAGTFPDFDAKLLEDMARETEHLVRYVARENRPVMELLTADYTFVNERLAGHYGIPDVRGPTFQQVPLSKIAGAGSRRGLLTHGSVLTVSSYPNRTSPVRRGEWILTNILGDEPPPPPPNVPALDETQASNPDLPLRKQLELHRADPTCASCHVVMDELGFGFESFDATGRYREKDGSHPVDASGVLPSGESFNGAMELLEVLESRETEFVRTFTERLLTFALGRGVDYRDQCVIDRIVHETADGEHRLQDIVREIVLSDSFRRQGPDASILTASR